MNELKKKETLEELVSISIKDRTFKQLSHSTFKIYESLSCKNPPKKIFNCCVLNLTSTVSVSFCLFSKLSFKLMF